ncbi:MAG: hypothetical protein ABIH53_04495 [archaeon]
MTETTIGLLASLSLGGTAIYSLLYGMFLLGLLLISILILKEIYRSHKEMLA